MSDSSSDSSLQAGLSGASLRSVQSDEDELVALHLEQEAVQLVGAGADRRRLSLTLPHRGTQTADRRRQARAILP